MDPSVRRDGGVRSEINVTPLVDVVLVLLIIFMVVIPILQMGYPVVMPPERPADAPPPREQLLVRLDGAGRIFLNREQVPRAAFGARLRQATSSRGKAMVFFAADGALLYGEVSELLDMVRNNGGENLGIVFDDIKPAGT